MAYNKKIDKNPTSVNILKLQRYNFKFFTLEEVVFFEYIIVKAQSFKFKPFYHSTETVSKEIGIKRTKLEGIIKKFVHMGIVSVEVKGFPKVKYFTVNFEKIAFFLPQIYQCEENGKLSAEMSKLVADFYNPLVETYRKKNNIISITKKNKEEEILEEVSGWHSFTTYFSGKIREWQLEFNLNEMAVKYEETELYQTYKSYGDDTVLYLREYLEKNKSRSKIADFLKPDKFNINQNAFIENLKVEEKRDAKKLLENLVTIFNNRRTKKSNADKKYSQTSLIINESIIEKAVDVLKKVDENAVNDAFLAYADAILDKKITPRKIFPLFFTYQYGGYTVIEEYLDYFNVHYCVR